jgi:hypothetical protein
MIPIVCETCGAYMGNKEEPYMQGRLKICQQFKSSDDVVSLEKLNNDPEYTKEMVELLDGLIGKHDICCAARLPNMMNRTEIIKGAIVEYNNQSSN